MTSTQVTEFEALRPYLMAVAYRVTGTVADAEDIVEQAWLRWNARFAAMVVLERLSPDHGLAGPPLLDAVRARTPRYQGARTFG